MAPWTRLALFLRRSDAPASAGFALNEPAEVPHDRIPIPEDDLLLNWMSVLAWPRISSAPTWTSTGGDPFSFRVLPPSTDWVVETIHWIGPRSLHLPIVSRSDISGDA